VRGNPELGAVLRGLRVANSLSQGQVATRVCCDASLVSMVESGKRVLQPDLARRLDRLYGTGTMITSLAGSLAYPRPPGCATLEGDGDVVLVQLPLRGVTVPVSRRALLAALSMGTTAEALGNARDAMAGVPADEELLAEMTQSLGALHVAG
jgi:transcriptional regulator with XRE-family HTH domain